MSTATKTQGTPLSLGDTLVSRMTRFSAYNLRDILEPRNSDVVVWLKPPHRSSFDFQILACAHHGKALKITLEGQGYVHMRKRYL